MFSLIYKLNISKMEDYQIDGKMHEWSSSDTSQTMVRQSRLAIGSPTSLRGSRGSCQNLLNNLNLLSAKCLRLKYYFLEYSSRIIWYDTYLVVIVRVL